MHKFFLLLLILCASITVSLNSETLPNEIFNLSNYSSNTYIGVSGRMFLPWNEIEFALLHIANQIAMRNKCIVDEGVIDMHGNRFNEIKTIYDSNFDYDDSNIDEIINYIEIIETYIYPELVIVIGKDSRKIAETNPYVPRNTEERPIWVRNPEWVRNLPGFENYYIGVGVSDRYSMFYRGFIVADVRAAQVIAAEKGIYTRNYLVDFVDDFHRVESSTFGNIALTQAELEGFYILDRWVEPDGSAYYSLGIARRF
jgi:hypothetical protein